MPPYKLLLTYYVWRTVWRSTILKISLLANTTTVSAKLNWMAYSELPWKSFLGHQAWSWTTLRRGNVFLLRLQTFFLIFVTFFITFTNVLLLLSLFFIFLWTFFYIYGVCCLHSLMHFNGGGGATTPKFVHSFGGSEPPLNTQFFWPTLIGGGRGQWLGGAPWRVRSTSL